MGQGSGGSQFGLRLVTGSGFRVAELVYRGLALSSVVVTLRMFII